jgi:FAD:protein FMN transferase
MYMGHCKEKRSDPVSERSLRAERSNPIVLWDCFRAKALRNDRLRLRDYFVAMLLAMILVLISGCSYLPVHEESFPVMGTVAEIKIVTTDAAKAGNAARKIKDLFKKIESDLSYYDPSSRLSRINKAAAAGYASLTEEESGLIRRSLIISALTEGAFDITFYPVWNAWKKAEKNGRLPERSRLEQALKKTGYRKIILSDKGRKMKYASKDISVNLGGIAKEYALEKCAELLKNAGVNGALVSLGGDILALGEGRGGGWKVGIQDPFDPSKIAKKITVKNKMVLTSGIYERYVEIEGKRYHHIIDMRTGYPVAGLASVTIVRDIGSKDPIPSIAIFLMGRERAMQYLGGRPDIGYCIIDSEGRQAVSYKL